MSELLEKTDDAPEQAMLGADFDLPLMSPGRFSASVKLLILLLGTMSSLGPLAIDMYLPSFPTVAKEFGVSVAEVERTLAIYFVGLAFGQLIYGPASDRFGRKKPLYVGLVLFILGSTGCAMAHSVHWLMLMRAIQALGGCAEMVVARAIVRDRFNPQDATRVFSSLMLVMGLAPILAPLIGGWLITHFGWRSIFILHLIVASICLFNVFFFLPESLARENRSIVNFRQTGSTYLQMLSDRTFMMHTLSVSLATGGIFAYVGGSPFVFIELHHVKPEHFGYFFGINAAGLIGASQINGRIANRVPLGTILRNALIVSTIAGCVLAFDGATHLGGFAGILIPLFFFVASLGFIFPTAPALALAPHGKNAGNASAVLGSVQFGISGLFGMLISVLHNGTAMPMCGLIAVGAVAALLVNLMVPAGEPLIGAEALVAE